MLLDTKGRIRWQVPTIHASGRHGMLVLRSTTTCAAMLGALAMVRIRAHTLETILDLTIDYYLAPQSPWAYLGHARFVTMANVADARIRVLPADFGKVFAASGGLPLGKRAPQRQAYRLVELRRFAEHMRLPLHLHPSFFPVAGDDAARLILAVNAAAGSAAALRLTGAVLTAVWAQQRDISDTGVLAALLAENGLDAACLDAAREPRAQLRYEAVTQAALDAGVFGAPSYCVDGEIFWGQDRLDFLQRRLDAARRKS